jgi:hypothetical protein
VTHVNEGRILLRILFLHHCLALGCAAKIYDLQLEVANESNLVRENKIPKPTTPSLLSLMQMASDVVEKILIRASPLPLPQPSRSRRSQKKRSALALDQ